MTAPSLYLTSEPWPPFLWAAYFRPSVHAGANEYGSFCPSPRPRIAIDYDRLAKLAEEQIADQEGGTIDAPAQSEFRHSRCRRHRQFLARASRSCAARRLYQFA